jgi:phosphosulfolactate phosphohydrolase-like enzyme
VTVSFVSAPAERLASAEATQARAAEGALTVATEVAAGSPAWLADTAAGGIVSKLGRRDTSPEAHVAASAFEQLASQREAVLRSCAPAMELTERGFAGDVALCLEEDVRSVACRLVGGRFIAERPA